MDVRRILGFESVTADKRSQESSIVVVEDRHFSMMLPVYPAQRSKYEEAMISLEIICFEY